MYLIAIGWIYVVLMMSVAEATNTTGTVLGAVVTFVLYGMLPVALVVYLMGAPGRNRALKKREADVRAQQADSLTPTAAEPTGENSRPPDTGSHTASGSDPVSDATANVQVDAGTSIAPVRKEL